MIAIRYGSLFSGCGGMDLGLDAAGMECAWQVEINKACRSVLARHWKSVPKFGDITEVHPEELGAVGLISGGSPCQDLSTAGRGEGLDGKRSGLFFEFCRIADSQPGAWILWENVDGALSSSEGADFGIILRELSGFWPAVPADGWKSGGACIGSKRWLVWRVLDSQYFGVPQRRRRVFIVGGPRGGACFPEVLLEPESLSRNPPACRSPGESVAALLAGGAGGRGHRLGADEAAGGHIFPIQDASGPVKKGQGSDGIGKDGGPMYTLHRMFQHGVAICDEIARPLTTRNERLDFEPESFVANTLMAYKGRQQIEQTYLPQLSGVRRLTPTECERLQGYPDGHTAYGANGQAISDSKRYEMIGNGVTAPVAEWIGWRIMAIPS